MSRPRSNYARTRGFTLVEVLAALMLMAIVLPAVMQGVSLSTAAATAARRRSEAAGLAGSKLAEIVSTGQWQGGGLSGDFGDDWRDYRWEATVQPWSEDTTDAGLQQIDLRVSWLFRGRDASVTVSTLAHERGSQ